MEGIEVLEQEHTLVDFNEVLERYSRLLVPGNKVFWQSDQQLANLLDLSLDLFDFVMKKLRLGFN